MAKVEPFEKYTSRYDEWFEKNRFVYESELQAVRSLLPEQGIGIEIGVGTGRFAAPLGINLALSHQCQWERSHEEEELTLSAR